ncbi:MAG: penicillin-binding protein beta-lactamase class [Bacteroidetes bacterium]|nr:penicillin-binding protein beta-lactamase class [Bacteroidota bacterium]
MKRFLRVLLGIAIFLLLLAIFAKLTGNGYLLKGVWASYLHGHNSATIDDAKYFDTHKIEASPKPSEWPLSSQYNKSQLPANLQATLSKTETVSFLVIKNDSILAEQYWEGYSDSSQSNSFSMAKSVVTMLTQIAIQKGILKDWHQKVKSVLPGVIGPHADELELWHLSTMSSGLLWDEEYKDPFSVTAKAYYGEDVKKLMSTLPIVDEPGKVDNYQSGSTQMLGLCLIQATGKSLADLASEWLWKPLQAQRDAQWHTDSKGIELAYCCFNTNARDFARFGKLMLHQGNWNGTQILDSSFVKMATAPVLASHYGYSFWLYDAHGTKVFAQRGILGQYIITIPEYNTVVVRLGRHCGRDRENFPDDFRVIVDEALGMVKAQ